MMAKCWLTTSWLFISRNRELHNWKYLYLVVLVGVLLRESCVSAQSAAASCTDIVNIWNGQYKQNTWHQYLNQGQAICQVRQSCCTPTIEAQMTDWSMTHLTKVFDAKLNPVTSNMKQQRTMLKQYISTEITTTSRKLDKKFRETYKDQYTSNAVLFSDFFKELQNYMDGKAENISQISTIFFDKLRTRMVELLTANEPATSMPKSQLIGCISNNMGKDRQITDLTTALTNRLLKVYPLTRSIVNALLVGEDSIDSIKKLVTFSPGCLHDHVKMKHCNLCAGTLNVRPCRPLCVSVLNTCLAEFTALHTPLKQFLDELLNVMSRIESSFSLPEVNAQLDIDISSIIMAIQGAYGTNRTALLGRCTGQASVSGSPFPTSFQRVKRNVGSNYSVLKNMVKFMKTPYSRINNFAEMPGQICDTPRNNYHPLNSPPCWNGRDMSTSNMPIFPSPPVARLTPPLMGVRDRLVDMTKRLQSISVHNTDPLYLDPRSSVQPQSPVSPPNIIPNRPDGAIGLPIKPEDTEDSLGRGSGGNPIPSNPSKTKKPKSKKKPKVQPRPPLQPQPFYPNPNGNPQPYPVNPNPTVDNSFQGSGGGPFQPLPNLRPIGPLDPNLPYTPDDEDGQPQTQLGQGGRDNFQGSGNGPLIPERPLPELNPFPQRPIVSGSGGGPNRNFFDTYPRNNADRDSSSGLGGYDGSSGGGDIYNKPIVNPQLPLVPKPEFPAVPVEETQPKENTGPHYPKAPPTQVEGDYRNIYDLDLYRNAPPGVWLPMPRTSYRGAGMTTPGSASITRPASLLSLLGMVALVLAGMFAIRD